MSTTALLGLLVVLLVAIGIAGFLTRGRRGARGSDPSGPPRTVAELVDRRRAGDDGAVSGPDDRADRVDADAPAVADETASGGSAPVTAGEPDDLGAGGPAGRAETSSRGAAVSPDSAGSPAAGASPAAASPDAASPDTASPDAVVLPDAAEPASEVDGQQAVGSAPSPGPRPGSDADTGPSSAPWSRGFVDGRQITPPTPTPFRRTDAADTVRPSAPPRQQSQSPVDPDLVKRVTAVPSTPSRRAGGQELEREFREARDRMAGSTGTRSASRVPEQSRSPESGGTAGPVAGTAGSVGSAGSAADPAGSADSAESAGSSDAGAATPPASARPSPSPRARTGDPSGPSTSGDEPPPRPSPRVMRSVPSTAAGAAAAGAAALGAAEFPSSGSSPAERFTSDEPAPTTAPTEEQPTGGLPEGTGSIIAGPAAATEVRRPTTGQDAEEQNTVLSSTHRSAPATATEEVVAFTGASTSRREAVATGPAQDVDVQVTDREARPLPGVALSMVDDAGSAAASASTGAAGEARLRAPGAGQYAVVASASGYQTQVASCAVDDEPVRVAVTLARTSAVHGTVRSGSDALAGVVVVIDQDGDTLDTAETGADGTFRFTDLTAGHYRLLAGDGAPVTVHVPAGTDVEQHVSTGARA